MQYGRYPSNIILFQKPIVFFRSGGGSNLPCIAKIYASITVPLDVLFQNLMKRYTVRATVAAKKYKKINGAIYFIKKLRIADIGNLVKAVV